MTMSRRDIIQRQITRKRKAKAISYNGGLIESHTWSAEPRHFQ